VSNSPDSPDEIAENNNASFVNPTVVIREGKAEDYPLLYDAFFKVYGQSRDSWWGRGVPHRILRAKMEQLLEAPGWRCLIACPSHEPDEIMGMLVFSPPNVRTKNYQIGWITTKGFWSKQGIAKALLKSAGIDLQNMQVDCAFMMPKVQQWAAQRGYKLLFKPYIPDIALWNTLLNKNPMVENGK
jgi:hypothetical protein